MNSLYLSNYFSELKNLISSNDNLKLISKTVLKLKKIKKKNKVIIFGNGGSAAIASHFTIDMLKNTNIQCITLGDSSLITCLTNDYGYENLNQKFIEYYGNSGDILIAISSSGESKNIINACKKAKKLKFSNIITLSGFKKKNNLSKMGNINFWVNSKNYNLVENTHQIYLLSMIDLLTKKKF
tara:strand:- start:52 stop:600 length:549 start_codon:yes stop_codon:yes gene_type:complete